MRVLKLGGGCLADAAAFAAAAGLVLRERRPPVVVVSAVRGVTNALVRLVREAASGGPGQAGGVAALAGMHRALATACLPQGTRRELLLADLDGRAGALDSALEAVAAGAGEGVRAAALSYGERCAALLLAAVVAAAGRAATAVMSDGGLLVGDGDPGKARVDLAAAALAARRILKPLIAAGTVPVVTGFFGGSRDGGVVLFGRNGSDYSAAVVARAAGAGELVLFKDVDGFMTADPKVVPDARAVAALSFSEAAELAYFGARVLHPRALEPLAGTAVRVRLCRFAAARGGGTVVGTRPTRRAVASVASSRDVAVLRVRGAGVGARPGVIGAIGDALAAAGVNILSVITAQTCIDLLLAQSDADAGMAALGPLVGDAVGSVEVERGWALAAVVGEGLRARRGVLSRALGAVARAGVNVEMAAAGASEVACYLLVQERLLDRAVRAIHAELVAPRRRAGRPSPARPAACAPGVASGLPWQA